MSNRLLKRTEISSHKNKIISNNVDTKTKSSILTRLFNKYTVMKCDEELNYYVILALSCASNYKVEDMSMKNDIIKPMLNGLLAKDDVVIKLVVIFVIANKVKDFKNVFLDISDCRRKTGLPLSQHQGNLFFEFLDNKCNDFIANVITKNELIKSLYEFSNEMKLI